MTDAEKIRDYWGRERLTEAIFESLAAAGANLEALTIDALAATDQFHSGGKPATMRLARLASPKAGTRVLDVGGGFGGPARTLAVEFGCEVTSLDLTESYVRAGEALTAKLRLEDRVRHRVGNALELPFDAGEFDMVWTQNSGMNIADKETLYAGFHRVLRAGGRLAIQEPMAGPGGPAVYPVMWARDPSGSFLRTPEAMRALIERTGFRVISWDDITEEAAGPSTGATVPAHSIQRIVMGDAHLEAIRRAGEQNRVERRIVMVQAVFNRG